MPGYFFRGQMNYFPDQMMDLGTGGVFQTVPKKIPKGFYISIEYAQTERAMMVYWTEMLDDIKRRLYTNVSNLIKDMYSDAIRLLPIRSGKLADEFVQNSTLNITPDLWNVRFSASPHRNPAYPEIISHAAHSGKQGWAPVVMLKNPIPASIIKQVGNMGLYNLQDPNAQNDYMRAWQNAVAQRIQNHIYQSMLGAKYTLQIIVSESFTQGDYDDDSGELDLSTGYKPFVEIGRVASGRGRYRLQAVQGAKIFINGSNLDISYGGASGHIPNLRLP